MKTASQWCIGAWRTRLVLKFVTLIGVALFFVRIDGIARMIRRCHFILAGVKVQHDILNHKSRKFSII